MTTNEEDKHGIKRCTHTRYLTIALGNTEAEARYRWCSMCGALQRAEVQTNEKGRLAWLLDEQPWEPPTHSVYMGNLLDEPTPTVVDLGPDASLSDPVSPTFLEAVRGVMRRGRSQHDTDDRASFLALNARERAIVRSRLPTMAEQFDAYEKEEAAPPWMEACPSCKTTGPHETTTKGTLLGPNTLTCRGCGHKWEHAWEAPALKVRIGEGGDT